MGIRVQKLERFLSHVNVVESGCWEWDSADHNGYGIFQLASYQSVKAHRFAFEQIGNTPIPDGLCLDHLCRNRRCVNPDHLEIVTNRENIQRGVVGINQRVKTHCPQGHPYDASNTYITPDGFRQCRTCTSERKRVWNSKRRLRWV